MSTGTVLAGDVPVGEMARLAERSWAEAPEPGFAHDLESLRGLGAGEPEVAALTAGLRERGELVAMALGLPRRARVLGAPCRLSLVTDVAVAPGQKGRGLGRAVLAAAIVRAFERGLDAALWYAVSGSPMDRASAGAARDAGAEAVAVAELAFLRALPSGHGHEDAGRAERILAREWSERGEAADVARCGDDEEARRVITGEDALAVSLHAGSREGAIVGRLVRLAGRDAGTCAVIDESCWGSLLHAERVLLARAALGAAAARGARLASIALMSQDSVPWREAGCRLSPRRMTAWIAPRAALPRALRTIQFDVS